MYPFMVSTIFSVCVLSVCDSVPFDFTPHLGVNKETSRCYDRFNRPQRCIPEFENAAFHLPVEATNTCGQNGDQLYCVQTGVRRSCEICKYNEHHPGYLCDFHNVNNLTWWQSETMLEGVQEVNLTLNFGKAFDVTYVRLWFNSPRPESFYLSKKSEEGGEWIPYQYYSASCRDTYGLPDSAHARRGEEARALCTSEYSDISPLRGGNVAFGTLEGRPSAYNFDSSPELQEWVTATEIKITLDRLNTFGDEVFGDPQVLRSYFYAIADVAVGARCKCNGHASSCTGTSGRRVCQCEHNTAGVDCGECLEFYNDAPWARATAEQAFQCKECHCNGYSTRCMFDQTLYEQSGHGGHCLDCSSNRDGANCEKCRPNYFMKDDGYCESCNCNEMGSLFQQCNAQGQCQCKFGVDGDKCDRCKDNHFDFSAVGCKACNCNEAGSLGNALRCDVITGACLCKENVEGRQCRECKLGYFDLDRDNDYGCTPCFCFGHSSECKSASGFSKYLLESTFAKGSEKWQAQDNRCRLHQLKYESISQSIGVQSDIEDVYFVAPDRFLGDRRASYNQLLQFRLRISDSKPRPGPSDVILEAGNVSVSNTLFAHNNSLPSVETQKYTFRLNERSWQPRLSPRAFMSLLTNLTSIRIRGTYAMNTMGFLDDFHLQSAARGVAGNSATWIELCECPPGYIGQYCESCAPGYRHAPSTGGAFSPCIPCDCNGHASICDAETGQCICQHNTAGENCQLCAKGYYGNALMGTPTDCLACGCPHNGPCVQVEDDLVICTECPVGYTGHKCDLCSDGYFGVPCQPCNCNQNIDPNAIGNCNTTTGECLRCIYNTYGRGCEQCLPGYFGNALVLPKGDCRRCTCSPIGTEDQSCDQTTGACHCKPHVIGSKCDQCEAGFFNLDSGNGCLSCNCDPIGSHNQSCDLFTGQCPCREGVTGLRCDHCEARKYGFSLEGCRECECDRIGSRDLQCDARGQCPCLNNVEGRKCDRCKENKFDRQRGCVDCPDCYNLVQAAYRNHTNKVEKLSHLLEEIERKPVVVDDQDFPKQLHLLENDLNSLHGQAATGVNLIKAVAEMHKTLGDISYSLKEVHQTLLLTSNQTRACQINMDLIDDIMYEAEDRLEEIQGLHEQAHESLAEADRRNEVVGQQNAKMTQTAQESRNLALKLEEKAENIVNTSNQAKLRSIEMYDIIKSSLKNNDDVSEQVAVLKTDLIHTKEKLAQTKTFSEDTQREASNTKASAVDLYNELQNLIIPSINVERLSTTSHDLKMEAFRLGNKSMEVYKATEELRKNLDVRTEEGRELLERRLEQQQEIEDIKNDVLFSGVQSDKAIELWNEILGRAEVNYKLLKDFDSQTQQSKLASDQALLQLPQIQQSIDETFQATVQLQAQLSASTINAAHALDKAQLAQQLAQNSSNATSQVKKEAETLQLNSSFLDDEADLMYDRVLNTEAELKNLLEKHHSNTTLVTETKEKVGRAAKDTETSQQRVADLLSDVMRVITELDSTPEINEGQLSVLEEQLEEAERQLRETRLEERVLDMERQHKSREELIGRYKEQISVLEGEVGNVEEILRNLPQGCFRRVELEP